jgi:hypothetical protein
MSNSTSISKESLPELVLLMQEPLIVDAAFLRSAYQAVLDLKLDGDPEFVTGQFPFFMFQNAGVLVSVTMRDGKFGVAEYREAFPHHDLSAVQTSLGFFDRRRIARHQGWIGACLLREAQPGGFDPYVHVGRALCPFALPGASVGLVAPRLGRAALYSKEHKQLLRTGDVRQIFGGR